MDEIYLIETEREIERKRERSAFDLLDETEKRQSESCRRRLLQFDRIENVSLVPVSIRCVVFI